MKETIPSLAELGGTQLYPADPSVGAFPYLCQSSPLNSAYADRRPALLSVLRSLLASFSALTSSLLLPPPPVFSTTPPEWQRHVEWISIMSQNIMAAANDLRPVQVKFTHA